MNEIIQQIWLGIKTVSLLGIIPVLFLLMICVDVFLVKKGGGFSIEDFFDRRKNCKTERIYTKVDGVIVFSIGISIIVLLAAFLLFFNSKFETYIYGMLNKIEVWSDIINNMTSVCFMMIFAVIVFDKKYYICFSIRDVLQKYRLVAWVMIVLTSYILMNISTMTLLDGKVSTFFDVFRFVLLEIAAICNIVSVTYICYVVLSIMLLDGKKELNLLEQLYKFFLLPKVDTSNFKQKNEWGKEAIGVNLEHLMNRYLEICKTKKIREIEKIEFGTTMKCYKQTWYKRARVKFIATEVVLLIINTISNGMILGREGFGLLVLNSVAVLISIGMSYSKSHNIQLVLIVLYLDVWGYYIKKTNGTEKIVARTKVVKGNDYYKYIVRMNSLNAFFYIYIKDLKERHKLKLVKEQFEELLDWLDSVEEKSMILYFPFFTISFFMYEKNIKSEKIKEVYRDMVLAINKEYEFQRMMWGQIMYLTKNINKEKFANQENMTSFFRWIRE